MPLTQRVGQRPPSLFYAVDDAVGRRLSGFVSGEGSTGVCSSSGFGRTARERARQQDARGVLLAVVDQKTSGIRQCRVVAREQCVKRFFASRDLPKLNLPFSATAAIFGPSAVSRHH